MYQTIYAESTQSYSQLFANVEQKNNNDDMFDIKTQTSVDRVIQHYHEVLLSTPSLYQHFIDRKIDLSLIEQFKIGFCNRTLGRSLGKPHGLLSHQHRGQLQRLGLLKYSGHEFFHGALVFPYFNEHGSVQGAYGRRPSRQSRCHFYHHYWNAQKVGWFNAAAIEHHQELIICKSPIDAMTLLSYQLTNVVATMGCKGFNDRQLASLASSQVSRVYIGFGHSPDENRAALYIAQALRTLKIECYRIQFSAGLDVNAFFTKQANPLMHFCRLMSIAKPLNASYELLHSEQDKPGDKLVDIDEGILFYLDYYRANGRSTKSQYVAKQALMHFKHYCNDEMITRIDEVTDMVLQSYQYHLSILRRGIAQTTLSAYTQKERYCAVLSWLRCMKRFGFMPKDEAYASADGLH